MLGLPDLVLELLARNFVCEDVVTGGGNLAPRVVVLHQLECTLYFAVEPPVGPRGPYCCP